MDRGDWQATVHEVAKSCIRAQATQSAYPEYLSRRLWGSTDVGAGCPGSMHDTGCLGRVHWDDPEGWNGEGGLGMQGVNPASFPTGPFAPTLLHPGPLPGSATTVNNTGPEDE